MQVISRRVNEGIIIDDEIHVTVLDIHDHHVRLGISSPNDVPSYWEQVLYWEETESPHALQVH